jgi:hypothetical protein
MLKAVISRANYILKDAQQRLPVESVDVIEKVCLDIETLNDYISQEMGRIAGNSKLDAVAKSNARRKVLEEAGRKLEVLKDKCNYSALVEPPDEETAKINEPDEISLLQFMREREIRDRLFGMTEAQILSHFGASLFEGDNQLLLNAILNAPAGFELLSEHNLRKLRRLRTPKLPLGQTVKPNISRSGTASIIEIFKMAKGELDRLRKKELREAFPAKLPG